MWVYVCVYAHTRILCMWSTRCELRGLDGTSDRPDPIRTKFRHTCIRIGVQVTQVYIYAGRRDEILD